MENASQALFIAAGVLIAIMVISIGVYLFSSASTIAENYDTSMSATEIDKFNTKFTKYNKKANYIKENIDVNGKRTYEYSNNASVGYVFFDYNTISDVVSAINLAYSINSKNNYDLQSGIQVSISGNGDSDDWDYGNIGITPSIQGNIFYSNIKNNTKIEDKNYCYALSEINSKNNVDYIPNQRAFVSINELLIKYNNSKLNDKKDRIYEYGFKGETIINTETGLIDIIKFTLVKNGNF